MGAALVLLNGHDVKPPSKCFCLMPQVGATPEKVLLQWVAVNSETPNWPKHRREVIVKYSAPSWDIFTIASEAQHASVTQEAGKNVSAGRCAVL